MFSLKLSELTSVSASHDYKRGIPYANHDTVKIISVTYTRIVAWVEGSRRRPYKVTLSRENGGLSGHCSCPAFGEFSYFCKHMVAVGLFYIHHPPQMQQNHSSVSPLDHIKTYLKDLSADSLRSIILTQAERNNHFFDALLLKAEFSNISSFDANIIRHLIDKTIKLSDDFYNDYDDYDKEDEDDDTENTDYDKNLPLILNHLQKACTQDDFKHTKILIEYIFEKLEPFCDQYLVQKDCPHLQKLKILHITTCIQAQLDTTDIVQSLFSLKVKDEWDFYGNILIDYKDVLGQQGLVLYQDLVKKTWEEIAPLSRKKHKSHPYVQHKDQIETMIKDIMGDSFEALLDIKSKALSRPDDFIEIARLCVDHNNKKEALIWFKKGIHHFKTQIWALKKLVPLAGMLYKEEKLYLEACDVYYDYFALSPAFDLYFSVKECASYINKWDIYYEKMIAIVIKHIEQNTIDPHRPYFSPSIVYASFLVKLFLHEDNDKNALYYSGKYECDKETLLELADKIASPHKDIALNLYERQITDYIAQTNNEAYEKAFRLIQKLQILCEKHDYGEDFFFYIEKLKTQFKSKRNMMKLLCTIA